MASLALGDDEGTKPSSASAAKPEAAPVIKAESDQKQQKIETHQKDLEDQVAMLKAKLAKAEQTISAQKPVVIVVNASSTNISAVLHNATAKTGVSIDLKDVP